MKLIRFDALDMNPEAGRIDGVIPVILSRDSEKDCVGKGIGGRSCGCVVRAIGVSGSGSSSL